MFDFLPDEVLVDNIFLRLPTKSILQCRCVCKSWYSLITNPNFISTHFHSNAKTENSAIFLSDYHDVVELGRLLFLFDNQDYFRLMSLHLPDGSFYHKIVGSVNGLICISVGHHYLKYDTANFILFNPSIGHFLSIPPPFPPKEEGHHWDTIRCLGFDETNQDYKILYFSRNGCFVYSLNSNSWKSLVTSPVIISYAYYSDLVLFVNGGIHWMAIRGDDEELSFIVTFDVKDETFGEILLPESLVYSKDIVRITEFGESSIAIIEESDDATTRDIWVMKEYGLVESWIKLGKVDLEPQVFNGLGLRNPDELLIRLREDDRLQQSVSILSQDINNKLEEVRNLMHIYSTSRVLYSTSRVYRYVTSLVLLDKPNNISATFVRVTPFTGTRTRARDKDEVELRRSKRARKAPARFGAIG